MKRPRESVTVNTTFTSSTRLVMVMPVYSVGCGAEGSKGRAAAGCCACVTTVAENVNVKIATKRNKQLRRTTMGRPLSVDLSQPMNADRDETRLFSEFES